MPEPLIDRLSRLTPDGSGLDRDALLFAAGRASVRPGRRWAALTAALAASQLLTLVLLWPRPAPPMDVPPVAVQPAEGLEREDAPPGRLVAAGLDLSPPAPVENLVPAGPPLYAFGNPPPALLP